MKCIDIGKLSDSEIIDMFGPAAQVIISQRRELENSRKQLDESRKELNKSRERLDDSRKELGKSKKRLDDSEKELRESRKQLQRSNRQLDRSNKELEKSNRKLEKSESDLAESDRKLKKAEADLAEANRMIRQLYEAIDRKNFKLLKQLKERFAPGTKPKFDEGIDEPYSEATPGPEKEKKKAGRKPGTKNCDGFDFSRVELRKETLGTSEAGEKPRCFYKVDYIPGRAVVTEYSVYGDGEMPDQFGESFLTPSLAGYIASRKFQYCLPLYRIETLLRESGVPVSRVQLSDYCMDIAAELEPIGKRIAKELCSPKFGAVHADETSLTVVRTGEGRKRTCRMFVFATSKWEKKQAAVYRFEVDRKADRIISFFSDFSGTVICDDYAGYDRLRKESLGQIELARCWFHWRKRFEDIVLLIENSVTEECRKKGLDSAQTEAEVRAKKGKSYSVGVLHAIDELFGIEKEYLGKPAEVLLAARKSESKPKVEALFEKLRKDLPDMKGPILDAVNYGLRLEDDLKRFLTDPYVEMSNNLCERTVKDFVMARKNFLFSYSEEGARAAGTIMTVVRTARLNGLDPERYISHVLSQFSTKEKSAKAMADLDSLLPWSDKLPKELRGSLRDLPPDLKEELKEQE